MALSRVIFLYCVMLVLGYALAAAGAVRRGGGGRLWVVAASTLGLILLFVVVSRSVVAGAATLEVVPAASEARYRDAARRDNYLRRNTLTTADFPSAEFVPHEIRGLPVPLPGSRPGPPSRSRTSR